MKKTIKKCPRVLAIVIVSLISFVPFYYTLTMSTHSTDEIMLGVSAIPGKYLLTNISTALNDTFWVAFKNSLIVSLLSHDRFSIDQSDGWLWPCGLSVSAETCDL